MRFSERKGFVKVREAIQLEGMDDALRIAFWNAIQPNIFGQNSFGHYHINLMQAGVQENFFGIMWRTYFKQPLDSAPWVLEEYAQAIRKYFFRANWYEVYDFIEFILNWSADLPNLTDDINRALETEMSGYRVVGNKVTEIVTASELDAVDSALSQREFAGAAKHLQRAVELLFDRTKPDVRNSIKESISAVESAAKIITKNPKATLGDALKCIEQHAPVHPALKDSFSKLYGYTNDTGGIRHAMIGDSNVTKADAQFMLISCSAFINYLKAKK